MIKSIATAEHYTWGQNCDGWHLVKTQNLSVIQERMPAVTEEEKHYHQKARQFFYILSGEATFEIEDTFVQVKTGEGVEVPPGTIHKIMNKTNNDLLFTITSQPTS